MMMKNIENSLNWLNYKRKNMKKKLKKVNNKDKKMRERNRERMKFCSELSHSEVSNKRMTIEIQMLAIMVVSNYLIVS
jgi:hypothetical protein